MELIFAIPRSRCCSWGRLHSGRRDSEQHLERGRGTRSSSAHAAPAKPPPTTSTRAAPGGPPLRRRPAPLGERQRSSRGEKRRRLTFPTRAPRRRAPHCAGAPRPKGANRTSRRRRRAASRPAKTCPRTARAAPPAAGTPDSAAHARGHPRDVPWAARAGHRKLHALHRQPIDGGNQACKAPIERRQALDE